MADRDTFFELYRGLRHIERDVERWIAACRRSRLTPHQWYVLMRQLGKVRAQANGDLIRLQHDEFVHRVRRHMRRTQTPVLEAASETRDA